MNNGFLKFAASAFLAAGFLIQAVAPATAGEVHNRIVTQQHRIHAGVRDGQISHAQAARDERRLNRVRFERTRDLRRNGGHLTHAEYVHQNRQLNRNSSDVYNQRH